MSGSGTKREEDVPNYDSERAMTRSGKQHLFGYAHRVLRTLPRTMLAVGSEISVRQLLADGGV